MCTWAEPLLASFQFDMLSYLSIEKGKKSMCCLCSSFLLFFSWSGLCHCYYCFQKLTSLAGVPRLNSPPPLLNTSPTSNQERVVVTPRPIRVTTNIVTPLEDIAQPWTRSPTKSKMEPVLATWHFISSNPLHTNSSVVGKCTWLRECLHSLLNMSVSVIFSWVCCY